MSRSPMGRPAETSFSFRAYPERCCGVHCLTAESQEDIRAEQLQSSSIDHQDAVHTGVQEGGNVAISTDR